MTDYAAQQGYGLSAPASRQDIVSALLSEYGNSFGRGDGSPSAFSPVPADKELPPPPPRSDSLRYKPLPAVERAERQMSMKFQLRVIEDAPLSPTSARTASPEQRSRRRIMYRSLSREAKPPSLNLVTSNGSTAIIPPTPAIPVRAETFPAPSNLESKDLPSPPPPPPIKSERRASALTSTGLQQSKSQRDLARNDSLLSQGNATSDQAVRPTNVEAVPAVKRKALPEPVKRFKSLAELGTGRRGGKGGPLPPISAPQKMSVESQILSTSQDRMVPSKEDEIKAQATEQQRDAPALNQLPPTPEDDKTAVPAPPRKVALGLPSNPRAKGGPISPKHIRGKSSTGFNLLKAQRPAPPIPTMRPGTITPEMTPSPTLKPELPKDQEMSPLSPLPPPTEQSRPFSFEMAQAAKPQVKVVEQQPADTMISAIAPSVPKDTIRPQSLSPPEPSPTLRPSTAPLPPSQNATPTSHHAHALVPSPTTAEDASTSRTPTPPPFTPLTRAPIPLPVTFIPAITPAQLNCYTSHKHNIWSNNTFQPMGCMVCHQNEKDRKWSCTWCQLRICRGCSLELMGVEGRKLGVLLEVRRKREELEMEMRERDEEDENGDVEREYIEGKMENGAVGDDFS